MQEILTLEVPQRFGPEDVFRKQWTLPIDGRILSVLSSGVELVDVRIGAYMLATDADWYAGPDRAVQARTLLQVCFRPMPDHGRRELVILYEAGELRDPRVAMLKDRHGRDLALCRDLVVAVEPSDIVDAHADIPDAGLEEYSLVRYNAHRFVVKGSVAEVARAVWS